MVLSLTAIGPSGHFETDERGPLALNLRRVAQDLSRQLGWRQERTLTEA